MAPPDRLPPPPANPVRSPAVVVPGEALVRVSGLSDGAPALEALVHAPADPAAAVRAVLLCHPHPLYGGSMHSPVPLVIAKALAQARPDRVAWARFNFRGVGASEGSFDGGRGEVDDALAVLSALESRAPSARLTVCGHSFGAAVALRVAARQRVGLLFGAPPPNMVERVLLIAPSARQFNLFGPWDRLPPHITIFIGDRDELCDLDDVRGLARDLGAEIQIFEGYDHHFLKSRHALAQSALPVIAPEATQP